MLELLSVHSPSALVRRFLLSQPVQKTNRLNSGVIQPLGTICCYLHVIVSHVRTMAVQRGHASILKVAR